MRLASLAVTVATLAGLLAWQFGSTPPTLQRATVEQRMRDVVLAALSAEGSVAVVEADLRFTRASIRGQRTLLVVLYVRRAAGVALDDDAVSERVATVTRHAITSREPDVTPVVATTLVAR